MSRNDGVRSTLKALQRYAAAFDEVSEAEGQRYAAREFVRFVEFEVNGAAHLPDVELARLRREARED
jgi:hypothetical protein